MFGIDLKKVLRKKKPKDKEDNGLFEDKLDKNQDDEEDDDQNFIRKDEPQEEKSEETNLDGKPGAVRPEGNQQRNLDREHGGLEAKFSQKPGDVDVWDGRSEEVDRMGSVNAFQKASIKSMIWRYKKQKLDEAKDMIKEAAQEGSKEVKKQSVGHFDSREGSMDQQGYVQRIKHMQQDHTGQQGGFSNTR